MPLRDYVRLAGLHDSSLIRQSFRHLGVLIGIGLLAALSGASMAADQNRRVKDVRLDSGGASKVIKGKITGRDSMDYQVRAGAGQTLKARLKGNHQANYFNLIAPGSGDTAMYIGQFSQNDFEGMLPVDGVYTVRVYLMRSAARRNESANFALTLSMTGSPLQPLPASADALVPGTPYHAQGRIACAPRYSAVRECDAGVIRRGHDGTATVVLKWHQDGAEAGTGQRRILFVKGVPTASDSAEAMRFSKNAQGDYLLEFGADERFEVPEVLPFGD